MSVFARLSRKHALLLAGVAFGAILSTGIVLQQTEFAAAQPDAPANTAVTVSVRTLTPATVRIWSNFSGRMNAVDYAEIRPEVSGRIVEIRFKDGQTVQAGDVLFVIDPRAYEAAVGKANADLISARANAALAGSELGRATRLIKTQAISQSTYDQRANARNIALANVKVAEAALQQAQIDVDHAYVKAPIAGRISRPEITLGNLVQTGAGAPLLASIISNDGIYADFEVDEQTYMNSIHADAETRAQEQKIPVELTVEGDGRVYRGTIYSFDNKIDAGSGTIRARARFDNKDGSLVPGMFVSVKLGSGVGRNVLLVPERAIGTDQSKKFVYVVESDDKAASRDVNLGRQVGGERIVLAGLRSGDRVIVDGLQHVAPGSAVLIQNAVADASGHARTALGID